MSHEPSDPDRDEPERSWVQHLSPETRFVLYVSLATVGGFFVYVIASLFF